MTTMPDAQPKTKRTCQDCGKSFVAGPYAKWGLCCRWKHRPEKTKKYVWTPEREAILRERYDGRAKGRAAEIAQALGWPTWVVKKHAQTLGLCQPWPADRRDWTPEEERFLWEHAGTRFAHWIAKRLGRSESSVVLKFKRLRISRCVHEGYTLVDLELCFGVDHRVIQRWVAEGKLCIGKRGTARHGGQHGDAWVVHDGDVLAFIREHPMAFRLDKVDQRWFMDLLLAGGVVRKALAAAKEEESTEGVA